MIGGDWENHGVSTSFFHIGRVLRVISDPVMVNVFLKPIFFSILVSLLPFFFLVDKPLSFQSPPTPLLATALLRHHTSIKYLV